MVSPSWKNYGALKNDVVSLREYTKTWKAKGAPIFTNDKQLARYATLRGNTGISRNAGVDVVYIDGRAVKRRQVYWITTGEHEVVVQLSKAYTSAFQDTVKFRATFEEGEEYLVTGEVGQNVLQSFIGTGSWTPALWRRPIKSYSQHAQP